MAWPDEFDKVLETTALGELDLKPEYFHRPAAAFQTIVYVGDYGYLATRAWSLGNAIKIRDTVDSSPTRKIHPPIAVANGRSPSGEAYITIVTPLVDEMLKRGDIFTSTFDAKYSHVDGYSFYLTQSGLERVDAIFDLCQAMVSQTNAWCHAQEEVKRLASIQTLTKIDFGLAANG